MSGDNTTYTAICCVYINTQTHKKREERRSTYGRPSLYKELFLLNINLYIDLPTFPTFIELHHIQTILKNIIQTIAHSGLFILPHNNDVFSLGKKIR